jgi:hypothetical protein
MAAYFAPMGSSQTLRAALQELIADRAFIADLPLIRTHRGYFDRKFVIPQILDNLRNRCARRIQLAWIRFTRGRTMRARIRARVWRVKRKASTNIQRVWRGYWVRRRITRLRAEAADYVDAHGAHHALYFRGREILAAVATDLVKTDGTVKSGYLKLKMRDGVGHIQSNHIGGGATAATDLVKKLVHDAYGENARRALVNRPGDRGGWLG